MSMSLPAEDKRHYVAVLQHTVHAVRTAGRTVEFCGECALAENDRVQKLLQTWSGEAVVSGVVAIAPEPVWWHLGAPAETRALSTDGDVRRFAARLPHHLRGPLESLACNAADGSGVSVDGEDRWLLGVTQGDALAAAAGEAIERGIVTAALGSATLDSVAAAITALDSDSAGVVRLWAPGRKESHVFTLSVRGIDAIDRCAIGYDTIFATVQQVFGLKTAAEAKSLFFEKSPEPAAAAQLASLIAPQLQQACGGKIEASGALSFACTGLTGNEAWFGRALAQALGLTFWQPDLGRFFDQLELKSVVTPGDVPSLSLLGTLHLAASHTLRDAAWHPSWGCISRVPRSRTKRRPVAGVTAPTPSSVTAAATIPTPAVAAPTPALAATVPPEPLPVAAPKTPVQPIVPPRAPVPLVSIPVASRDAESKTPAPAAAAPVPAPPKSEAASDRRAPTPQPTPVAPAKVSVPSAANAEARVGTVSLPATPVPPAPASPTSPGAPSPHRMPPGPVTARAVAPVSIHTEVSPAHARPTGGSNGDHKSQPPPPPRAPVEPEVTPRPEPTVIVLRRSGYWPLVGLLFAVFGVGVAIKFYLDAEAVKVVAEKQKRAAEQAQAVAEGQVAAAVEQVRLASEKAAHAELRVRELEAANAKAIEQVRNDTESVRREAVEQATREVIEQARFEAERQTVRLVARELAAARAAEVAAAPGKLQVASIPAGAEVHVAGRPAQRAPVTIDGLPPGRHAVRLTLAGHVPKELTAEIVASKITDLGPVKLERAVGGVAVSSSPAGVEFSIRAPSTPAEAAPLRRGRTPAELGDLPAGDYVLQFTRAGWPERIERVTVKPGATVRISTAFQTGTVTINSSPTGATVLQGGLLLGKTPLTLGGLPPKEVTYELTLHGYEPLKLSGKVIEGRALELNGTLADLDRLVSADEVKTPPRPFRTTPLSLGRIARSAPPIITVSFVVLPDGSLEDVKVLEKVDRKLAEKSVEAIEKWKFYPGVSHAGYPVKVRMSMPVRIAGG